MCRKRDPEQVGKALLWLPWFVVNQFLQAFEMAEDILGKPPTLMHVLAVFEDNFEGNRGNFTAQGARAPGRKVIVNHINEGIGELFVDIADA